MGKSRRKSGRSHVGGFQLPLVTPDSDWTSPAELPDLRGKVREMGLDVETKDGGLASGRGPGWATGDGYICGVSAAWREGTELFKEYYSIRHPDTPDQFSSEQVSRWIRDHAAAGVRMVFHSAGYDLGWLDADLGVDPSSVLIEDSCALAVMVDENRNSYRLDDLCRWRNVTGKDEAALREAAAAYDVDPKSGLWRLPARYVGPYGAQDPAATLLLADSLRPVLAAEETEAAYRVEMELVPLIHAMRKRGIRIDLAACDRGMAELRRRRDHLLEELGRKLGTSGVTVKNCRSPDFLEKWFEEEGVSVPFTTKSGRGSFTAEWMREHEHWLPSTVSKITQLDSAAEKFIQGFICDYVVNGRLHATINQYRSDDQKGTRTTRLSYSDPPLQEMPARDEEIAAIVRGCFLPEEGEKWFAPDYSQQELRLMVHYAAGARKGKGLPRAVEALEKYRNDPDTDFHQLVIDWTSLERKPAKNVTFAKGYGAKVPKIAAMIGKSRKEAEVIVDKYDREMPFVSKLSELCEEVANERGYLVLLDGARSHFDKWEPAYRSDDEPYYEECDYEDARSRWGPTRRLRRANTRKGMSRLIQGGAARQTKAAMLACWKAGEVPLVQMHDELGFSVADPARGAEIADMMRNATPQVRVPMKVDEEYGRTWGDAKHGWSEAEAAD